MTSYQYYGIRSVSVDVNISPIVPIDIDQFIICTDFGLYFPSCHSDNLENCPEFNVKHTLISPCKSIYNMINLKSIKFNCTNITNDVRNFVNLDYIHIGINCDFPEIISNMQIQSISVPNNEIKKADILHNRYEGFKLEYCTFFCKK